MSKLIAIADVFKESLETEYKIPAEYKLEIKKEWLYNVPNKTLYGSFWNEISYVYEELINNKWTLDDIFLQYNDIINYNSKGIIDIWFEEPYNFIFEFDEKQHFNQYRLVTLENGYKDLDVSFNYNEYYKKSSERIVEPKKSGFHKLKSYNPTVRIGYFVTNNHIKDFTDQELSNVRKYLSENNILSKIQLK